MTDHTPWAECNTGRRTLRACHDATAAVEDRMLARLSPAHRQQLVTALRTCIEALTQWPPRL